APRGESCHPSSRTSDGDAAPVGRSAAAHRFDFLLSQLGAGAPMKTFYFFAAFVSVLASAQDTTVHIRLDATDAPRRLFHIQMTVPARAGPLTLLYPEWIPGEHGPTGPITDLVGLKITANGQLIPWKRDDVNMYAFHLTVPDGGAN